jgi:hypothetical protein
LAPTSATNSPAPTDSVEALAPALDDSALNVPGFHHFTFNQLVATWEWYHTHEGECERQSPEPVSAGVYVHREEGATS